MSRRVFAGDRFFKDNGDILTDGAIAWDVAGSSADVEVFANRDLTGSYGVSVSLGALGYVPDIWLRDDVSYKATVTGTGLTTKTYDYVATADSTESDETDSTAAVKNAVKGGSFDSWGAGTSFSNISGAGAAAAVSDGWLFAQAGSASNAISRQTATKEGARYGLRMGRPTSSSSTDKLRLFQALLTDEAYRFRGRAAVLSVSLLAGANFSGASGVEVKIVTGTTEGEAPVNIEGGTWGGQATQISQLQAITTSQLRYEFSIAEMPDNLKEIGIQLAYTPAGVAGANDWVQIEDVQFEFGATASDFEHVPLVLDFLRYSASAFSLTLLDDADASAMRTTLGLGTAALVADNTLVHLAGTEVLTGAKSFADHITVSVNNKGITFTPVTGVASKIRHSTDDWLTLWCGASGTRWINNADSAVILALLNAGQVQFVNGSAAAPAISGINDPNTGIYFDGADGVYVSTGGTARWGVNSAGALVAQSSYPLRAGDGSVSAPSLSFANDTDNGWWRIGTNNWAGTIGGTKVIEFAGTSIYDGAGYMLMSTGKHTIPIMAGGMTPAGTNGADPATLALANGHTIPVMDFDQTTNQYACGSFPAPKSWDEGTFTYEVDWTSSGAGNVIFYLDMYCTSDDDPLSGTFGTAVGVTDTNGTSGDHMKSPESSAVTPGGSPAEKDMIHWRLLRDAASGGDTIAADVRVLGLRLYMNISARNDI